jgi:hypothetical protein
MLLGFKGPDLYRFRFGERGRERKTGVSWVLCEHFSLRFVPARATGLDPGWGQQFPVRTVRDNG